MTTLEQQIADEARRMLAFLDTSIIAIAHKETIEKFAQSWADHAVRNRPSSFVNVQLLEAAIKARRRFSAMNGEVSAQVWNDNYGAITALDDAIHAADVVE